MDKTTGKVLIRKLDQDETAQKSIYTPTRF
jgi:hypothetical protein